ncbi:MAG TPA: RHS repeat-associated core domain-containing protein [Chthoniobacterales bacterium]|nr:RHS repeat-associated core domain-containing protein [Chthoniobacterales bacterium]
MAKTPASHVEPNPGLEKYTYDVFGKPTITGWDGGDRPISNHGNRFLFTGREYIYTLGLYDYRYRIYHPELGRFIQTDPLGLQIEGAKLSAEQKALYMTGGAPETFIASELNLYRYCHNGPVNKNDPLGLDPMAVFFSNADDPRDTTSFQQRASMFQGTSPVETPTGASLVSLLSSTTGVERLAIHGHMWSDGGGGIRGTPEGPLTGNSLTGVYGNPTALAAAYGAVVGPTARTIDALVNALATAVAPDGAVKLFGCNSSEMAQDISAKLAKLQRGDISVSGAVGETNPRTINGNDVGLKNTWNTFRAGKKVDSQRGVTFR